MCFEGAGEPHAQQKGKGALCHRLSALLVLTCLENFSSYYCIFYISIYTNLKLAQEWKINSAKVQQEKGMAHLITMHLYD